MCRSIRYLINEDGSPFLSPELDILANDLDMLHDAERAEYRNQNASAVINNPAHKSLIVSGPGTGKSYLFLARIDYWLQTNPQSDVLVTSFVRKLVADLQHDINIDNNLTEEQKRRITAATLHKLARSIVERNHGSSEWQFRPYFRIIGPFWETTVWRDVLAYFNTLDVANYSLVDLKKQFHDNIFEQTADWIGLLEKYFELCRFFNAAGFADLIIRAKKALEENTAINESDFFIIDEYQDFNLSEKELIFELIKNAKGILIVGDDEQVLYERLKSGKASLIRELYSNNDFVKAMLPFCSRSSYHITKSTSHFISQNHDPDTIKKVYLPLKQCCDDDQKMHIIACATSATAVDYINKFIEDHKPEIDERKEKLQTGEETDAFLLILTPAKEVNFYGRAKQVLFQTINECKVEKRAFSEDYYRLLNYYALANNPDNNFTFRKVLYYEGLSTAQVHVYIEEAIQQGLNFSDLEHSELKEILAKCVAVKESIEASAGLDEKIDTISTIVLVDNKVQLKADMEKQDINQSREIELEHEEEEEAELEEIEIKKMCAIELMTFVGAKGLSADHVIVIGFDNVNMNWVTRNAFYVAMTRARKSLHAVTALQSGGATTVHNFVDNLSLANLEFFKYKKSDRSKTPFTSKTLFVNYLHNLQRRVATSGRR